MISALIRTAALAAVSTVAYRAWKSGRLDDLMARFLPEGPGAPALDSAYSGANASQPAQPHPWPVDKKALGRKTPVPDAG